MCGIAGVVSLAGKPVDSHVLPDMLATLTHRGPDDQGQFHDDRAAIGMRRLSIIDVQGGQQPLSNEDASVHCVFNGEIYNYRELRESLSAKSHQFRSGTDGEVITHLWEDHGADFASYLNGMFAVALYDQSCNKLVLVRDRLGVKPLYFAKSDAWLVFGSEIKAILASELVERRLDVDGLGQFLSWEYIPGAQTLFSSIAKLRPGEMLETDLATGDSIVRQWWDVTACAALRRPASNAADWEELVDQKVRQCVRRQLVSDVPLGAFLSGGVDSSLMTAAMGQSRTFSIGFEDASYNELDYARQVAATLGLDHRDEVVRPDVVDLFDRLMNYMEDPIADVSIFPTYLVSRLAREDVKVALSGDGGDELFGGYETYVAEGLDRWWRMAPTAVRSNLVEPAIARFRPTNRKKGLINKMQRFVEGANLPSALGHARWRLFADDVARQELFTPDALAEMSTPAGDHIRRLAAQAKGFDATDRALYIDVKSYLCDNILTKVDRMSMACSLEARVPYLDHELVELAFQIPSDLKVRGKKTKVLLKRVAARHVPRQCVYRSKEGFSIPMKQWLKSAFRPLMEELLSSQQIKEEGIFRFETVERLKREHLRGEANHAHVLWPMMVFQDWRRRWAA